MRRVVFVLSCGVLWPCVADAQTFEPYTITASEHQELMTYLGTQPFNMSAPIISQLSRWEQQAQKVAADAKAENEALKKAQDKTKDGKPK